MGSREAPETASPVSLGFDSRPAVGLASPRAGEQNPRHPTAVATAVRSAEEVGAWRDRIAWYCTSLLRRRRETVSWVQIPLSPQGARHRARRRVSARRLCRTAGL